MTRHLCCLLGLAMLSFAPTLAMAQAPTNTTHRVLRFQSCTESPVFACGMRDASGRRYGTAHMRQVCSTVELRPDGVARLSIYGGVVDSTGRYRMEGQDVHIAWTDPSGRVRNRETLRLSPDGRSLGDRVLVEPNE